MKQWSVLSPTTFFLPLVVGVTDYIVNGPGDPTRVGILQITLLNDHLVMSEMPDDQKTNLFSG